MDSWHRGTDAGPRLLSIPSGLVPGIPSSIKPDIPNIRSNDSIGAGQDVVTTNQVPSPPAMIVPSINLTVSNTQKLKAIRSRRRVRYRPSYLQSDAYIKYITRGRKDIDKKNGEIIWTEDVEASFHNALRHIPAMGRKKKSQHGRPYGRNELIGEWIYQETGKRRLRKQISSHLQVLESKLKNEPSWRALNTEDDETARNESRDCDYYDDSIQDMVRDWRLLTQSSRRTENFTPTHVLRSNDSLSSGRHLSRMDFRMWIGLPDKMDDALHQYTSIQSTHFMAAPSPLENVREWRTRFPAMTEILQNMMAQSKLNIILVNVSFKLMGDFPQKSSKLGIALELEFLPPSHEQYVLQPDTIWSCTTHIYHDGDLLQKTVHQKCLEPGPGKVNPPFESTWWAKQLTHLTEKRRRAQDTGDTTLLAAADEYARDYLQQLTFVQQLTNGPSNAAFTDDRLSTAASKNDTVAVLLWTFSQASNGYVGTTTWQKLIPPPDRITTNSPPLSLHEISQPPLILDSAISDMASGQFYNSSQPFDHHLNHSSMHLYEPDLDEDLCQDGYPLFADRPRVDIPHHIYDNASSQATLLTYDTDVTISFQDNQPPHIFEDYDHSQSHLHVENSEHVPYSQNLFDLQNHNFQQSVMTANHSAYGSNFNARRDSEDDDPRQPLMTFDLNTHQVLQQQLADEVRPNETYQDSDSNVLDAKPPPTTIQEEPITDDERVFKALADLSSHEFAAGGAQGFSSTYIPRTEFVAPVAIRPPLQQHHSFACILPVDPDGLQNTPERDFSKLLGTSENADDDLTDQVHLLPSGGHEEMIRPHSQPQPTLRELNEYLPLHVNDLDEGVAISFGAL